MKFVVEQVSKCSGRIGALSSIERLPDRTFLTPLLLFVNPNLSREVMELANLRDFAIALPVSNVEQMEKPLQAFKKGISEFVGLKESLTFLTIRNTTELTPTGHHERGSLPIWRKAGKINLTAQRHMNIVAAGNPDFYMPLADGDTWKDCSKKRVTKACERTQEFFEACLNLHKSLDGTVTSRMIAAVEGGYNEFERKKSVEMLATEGAGEHIAGYLLDGFHRNGYEATQVDVTAVKEIVKFTTALLPEDKMRLMFGSYLPHVTLQLIALGIDIFDTSLVHLVTSLNRALVFNFDLSNPVKRTPEIDLTDASYKEDFTAFLDTCDCLACRQHTKAYTNHLLLTGELLGPMLLTIHNLHHYKRFFEAIRECIKNDKLQELIDLVSDQYKQAESLKYEQPEITKKSVKRHHSE
jgi:queuine tRNA-ribosyltransferase subunit QTRTD1